MNRKSSTAAISQELKTTPVNRVTPVQPRRVFTEHDAEKITEHYHKLPSHLKKLMKACIYDKTISFDFVLNPVFIKQEGRVYNSKELIDALKDKPHAIAPISRVNYTLQDIIPCNSLIVAMENLLDIITNKEVKPIVLENKLASLNKNNCRNKISAESIVIIEKSYEQMAEKHKLLFNSMCRDPITHIIMDDPVLLPDGYVYDRSTAMAYVEYGVCPLNTDVNLNKDDITPCHYVIEVLEQLKKSLHQLQPAVVGSSLNNNENINNFQI